MNPYAVAPWVISVGATDEYGSLASYSARGVFGDPLQHPTLVAPGNSIVGPRSSIVSTGLLSLLGDDTQRLLLSEIPHYKTATGTSFSAPQVTGAIALMLEANPDLTPPEIKDILSRTATPLPKYFYHEVGAGMLNTHAAVLEAAFPARKMGMFRSTLSQNSLKFSTSTLHQYNQNIAPRTSASSSFLIPANTLQATVSINWATSLNDFGLRIYKEPGGLVGRANYLNIADLTGRREKVVLHKPASGSYRSSVSHTLGLGTSQQIFGAVEATRIEYPELSDINLLSFQMRGYAEESLVSSIMLPLGKRFFRPGWPVRRIDLAEAFVRGGWVPQYMKQEPMFDDVTDLIGRNAAESVQSNPGGALIYDVNGSAGFNPHSAATRLVAAVAFVKAAGLQSSTASTTLSTAVSDRFSIPAGLRGYVAVAIQKGFLNLDGNAFNPNRPITRIEMAKALVEMKNLA